MSDKILVFGHQKPDTDAIGSSYGFSYLSNHRHSAMGSITGRGGAKLPA